MQEIEVGQKSHRKEKAMKVTIGEAGLKDTWQGEFPKETKCVHCKGVARIGFVVCECLDEDDNAKNTPYEERVCALHGSTGEKGGLWLHDCVSVAIYFCCDCLNTTALYNQA